MATKNKIRNSSILFIIIVVSALTSSCGWLDCKAEGFPTFRFILNYSVDGFSDTLHIDDTITISHDLPFRLADVNGVEYNLSEIPYFPLFALGKLLPNNKTTGVEEEEFEIIPIGKGDIFVNYLSDGSILREVVMVELEDRYSVEFQLVPLKTGEYNLHFLYLDSDLIFIQLPDLDNCNTESVHFDYNFTSDTSTTSRFANDSLWLNTNGKDINLLEIDKRYDIYNFVVVE